MIHGILAIAGVPFPQRVLKSRLGTHGATDLRVAGTSESCKQRAALTL
jgi:hypothetical protein